MAPLEITVEGLSSIHRHAERGVISVAVSSDGSSKETVSQEVTSTSNLLQQMFKELAPKTETGTATSDAPITVFSMGSIQSWSRIQYDKDNQPGPRQYHASSSFEVIFRDFEKLGDVASSLFAMPHVDITSISWRLTDETRESLGSETRKAAMLNAIQKARDYAEVIGREVVAVKITDSGYSAGGRTKQTARRAVGSGIVAPPNGLALEPEEVVLSGSVQVQFATE